MVEIFEVASRRKYRYPYKGYITTEDLWDLSPKDLDFVYKSLMKTKKTLCEESLSAQTNKDDDLETQINIVKYVYTTKEVEYNDRKKAAENAEKRRHILEILAQKKDESLRNMSEADLLKLLDETV